MNKYLKLLIVFVFASCSASDYTKDLGDGYLLVSESNANQFITHSDNLNGKVTIACTVEAFLFNDSFIVATQRKNPDCFGDDFSALPLTYWIIDKKKKAVIGPLDSLSFEKKHTELSIPVGLDIGE